MLRNKKILRFIAVFLLLNTLYFTFLPTISYALTSGPTAPEYTSFEPVDTTDMVNLATGDFTYNIPLLEVPGPEGGYPLSLSYHAGIQPNEEASWVGLGWTLNPGAINRTVNGYADDHYGAERTVIDNWVGGRRSSFSVGVGLPGMSFGLSFSQDTYQGFGIGVNTGVGLSIGGEKSPLSLGVSASSNPYSGGSASIGFNLGLPISESSETAMKLGVSAGISTNFDKISGYASIGISANTNDNSYSLLGASISSDDLKPSLESAGVNLSQVNSNAGKITVESRGFTFPMPLPNGMWLNIGQNYTRYYSNEASTANTWGALYPGWRNPDDNSFDSYALLDPDANGGIVDNPEADKVLGGSMIAADHYSVTGQGISGSMQPYSYFNGSLFRQNLKKQDSNDNIIEYVSKRTPHSKVAFRFNNDFSNTYHYKNDPEIIQNISTGVTFDNTIADYNSEGFNGNKQHMAGSKHIEYFTNEQIQLGEAFTDYNFISLDPIDPDSPIAGSREGIQFKNLPNQIGGFMITNESGVTYHYSLPVYSYDEVIYSETIDDEQGNVFNKKQHPHPYAYTWLLTAITGPDYVNRNPNNDGTLSNDDWGYWVKFDYGMWADNYQWRNPATGYHKDIDENFQNYSHGKKELYYLDAIQTRTHTALFVKEIRADGKGAVDELAGDFKVSKASIDYEVEGCVPDAYNDCTNYLYYYKYPTSILKLNKIFLIKNGSMPITESDLKSYSNEYDHLFNFNNNATGTNYVEENVIVHYGNNIIDVQDVAALGSQLTDNTIRIIDFGYDYSLQPETINSFDPDGANYTSAPSTNELLNSGKLTLTKLNFLGKKGVSVIPAMNFSYDYSDAVEANFSSEAVFIENGQPYSNVTCSDTEFNENVIIGDLVKMSAVTSGNYSYGLLTSKNGNIYKVKILGKDYPASSGSWHKTKNPPYQKDFVDMWGMYKSDYEEVANENINRMVTDISSLNVDSWSLRNIKTSLGSEILIAYESDDYENATESSSNLIIKNIEDYDEPNDLVKISFYNQAPLSKLNTNDSYRLLSYLRYYGTTDGIGYNCDGSFWKAGHYWKFIDETISIVSISSDYIIVKHSNLSEIINHIYGSVFYNHVYASFSQNQGQPLFHFDNKGVFIGGELIVEKGQFNSIGGGIRVSNISIKSLDENISTSKYSYSKGVTSYEPLSIGVPIYKLDYSVNSCMKDAEQNKINSFRKNYYDALFGKYYDLIANSRELPAPGVIYGTVKVTEDIQYLGEYSIQIPGSVSYDFQTFDGSMVQRVPYDCASCTSSWPGRSVILRNNTASVGMLKSVKQIDENGKTITETKNHYLHDEVGFGNYKEEIINKYNGQGLVSQISNEYRIIDKGDGVFERQALLTTIEEYPTVQLSSTSTNYKTGLTTTTKNLAFDFYSGEVTKTLSSDSYGNHYLSVSEPAYQKPSYAGMGLKVNNIKNKNMLSQVAANYTYKVNSSYENDPVAANIEGLVAANVQTWSDDWTYREYNGTDFADITENDPNRKIWRKHQTYQWRADSTNEDGTAPYTEFSGFNFDSPSTSDAQWQKTGEITLYDRYSHALEASDINGNFAATKMSSDNTLVLASVANAAYKEFAYSGAEDELIDGYFGGEVKPGGSTVSTTKTHTGTNSLKTTGPEKAFYYKSDALKSGKAYRASVWTTSTIGEIHYSVDGGDPETAGVDVTNKAGEWYLINANIPLTSGSTIEVWCNGVAGNTIYYDDFRFHPLDAAMTSYVYNEWGELSHILDANNLFTEYRYDPMGRLESTHRESFQYGNSKISEVTINYGRDKYIPPAPFDASLISSGTGNDKIFTAEGTGGKGPYTYMWYTKATGSGSYGVPVLEESLYSGPASFSPEEDCAYDLQCIVEDSEGQQMILNGNGGTSNLMSHVSSGFDGTTASINISGGLPPYTYSWKFEENDVVVDSKTENISSTASSWVPNGFQCDYKITCTITDACGGMMTKIVKSEPGDPLNITVSGPTSAQYDTQVSFGSTVSGGCFESELRLQKWFVNGVYKGGGASFSYTFTGIDCGATHEVKSEITDHQGNVDTDIHSISIHNNGGACP